MVAFVVPIGFPLGPSFSAGGDEFPDSFDIRLGGEFCSLSPDAYAVWLLTHGYPELVEQRAPTRVQVEEQASSQGVENPRGVFDELLRQGLLAQVMPIDNQLKKFAMEYRCHPLGKGLGNTAEAPEDYSIGTPEDPWAIVDYRTYFIWSYLPHFPSLWDAVTEIANYGVLIDAKRVTLDALGVLNVFIENFSMMLSLNCVYFDRRA